MRSTGLSALPPLLTALVFVCVLTVHLQVPGTVAVVSQTMGNITFECPDGWQLDGPDCYLLVDVAMVLEDARDLCGKYGSDVVEIQDEMEAKSVAKMVQTHYSQWDLYWINNNLTDADSVCSGFWGIGEPKEANDIPMSVSACDAGRWYQTEPTKRLPFVCKVSACVEGTFRCRDEFKCISNNFKCDGVYDCDDESDESNCPTQPQCSHTVRGGSGQLTETYTEGQTCTWFIEGSAPGKPLSIEFTSLNLEDDVDCVEVWSGGPSFKTSMLQERLCGSLPTTVTRKMYSHNNFLIVRLRADLSQQHSGLVATWAVDPELSQEERKVEATDNFKDLTSPYIDSDPSPRSYVRHCTVYSTDDADGSLITMEVLQDELGDGFEYDPKTLIPVGDTDIFPDTYVSTSNSFTFYLNSLGRNEPLKFKAKVMKGCTVKFTRTNGYLTSPNIPPSPYPPSTRCTYLIKGPQGAQRAFQLRFEIENLADDNDTVTVYDGNNSGASRLSPPTSGDSFVSTGTEVLVEFSSSLVQSNGSFKLTYDMACPDLNDTMHMQRNTNSTHFQTEVTLQCDTGYAFAQEEYASQTSVTIRCGLKGEWNVSRLPTCTVINCGIPEVISNGYVSEGSGMARYGHNVTYKCFLGFNMTGAPTSTCGDGSVWTERPSCSATQCPALTDPPNGVITKEIGNGTSSGTIYKYTCNAGYELVGARYRLCNSDGTWTPNTPTCTRIKCPIPEVARADLTPSSVPVEFNSMLSVTCNSGYVINGTNVRTGDFPCLQSGTFDVSRDQCVDLDECVTGMSNCTSHEQCKNTMGGWICVCEAGYIRDGSACEVEFGCKRNTSGCDVERGRCENDATCVCNTGYRLFSENGTSGRYVPQPEDGLTAGDVYYFNHTCVPVTCSNPPTVENGRPLTNLTQFDFNDKVWYRCDFGYHFHSNDFLLCNASGQWEDDTPVCEAIMCDPLSVTDSLMRAIYPSGPTRVGESVSLECFSESTETRYNKTLFCAFDRESQTYRLQGDSANCPAIKCTAPEPLGGASFTVTSTGLDASFTFDCLDGFTQEGLSESGNSTVICGRNGRWGFGNLTCTGKRCLDPGTPGGMEQVSANFQVNGTVVYNCTKEGFEADPINITCSYDSINNNAVWDSSVPVCKDVQKPRFSDCHTEPIKLKVYQSVMSKGVQEPSANDNSGLVFITKTPAWFRMGEPLAESVNVTYTASDRAVNEETCSLSIVVNDPSVLPSLDCPDYLTFPVDSDELYTVNLTTYVNASSDDTLTFDQGPELSVGPTRLGKTDVRVTATNYFGLQRQCAFVVDIKPNACLRTYISADNADVTCTSASGNMSCTAACKTGYAYHDGKTSKDYTCEGKNQWSPNLPALDCTDTVDSEYFIVVRGDYYLAAGLLDCLEGLKSKLEEMIPTHRLCRYNVLNDMFLAPQQITFHDQQAQNVTVEVSLGIDDSIPKNVVTQADYDICKNSFHVDVRLVEFALSAYNVSCTNKTVVQQLPTQTAEFVSGNWTCARGRVVQIIQGNAKCVKCAPGSFSVNGTCAECPDGQYQDAAGQTECKPCGNGAQHSLKPRASSNQCIASCGFGFTNGENFTQNPDLECKACPVDTYLDTAYTAGCKPCNASQTTSGQEGAKYCMDQCQPGMYPLNNTACAPCPVGFYKSVVGNEACTRCPTGKSTHSNMSTHSSDCVNFTRPACEHEVPNQVDVEYCVCEKGYSGQLCEVAADSCLSYPCYNGGTCNSTGPFDYVCSCPPNFNGTRCETDIVNNCTNSTCEDIEFCRDLIDTADCVCPSSSLHVYKQPKCSVETDVCGSNKCQHGATCLPMSDGVQAFTCVCEPGYTGNLCEQNIDDCKNNPDGCMYGGNCTDNVDNYTCHCGDYKGKHCESLPDFCGMNKAFCQNGLCFNDYNISSAVCTCDFPYRLDSNGQCLLIDLCTENNRCENNSTCTPVMPGVTRCLCLPGYSGSLCQHDIDDCASKPCVHGDCHDRVNGYMCDCYAGFNGTNCDNDIDDCMTSSCNSSNTANCEDLVNNYKCVCNAGWTGKDCQADIDECLSLPCQHGGTCGQSSTPGQYSCTCRDGWVGHDCSELEQFCQNTTCESGGTCHSLQDGFYCECVGGSSGKNCSIFENVCDTLEPCELPSSCQKNDNAASCNCSTGYIGTSCNLIEDSCKSHPCLNGGTCVPQRVGYTCKCAEGYSGDRDCAQAADPCDTITCPTGASCVIFIEKPVCLCGLNKVKTGSVCKDVNPDFDIYFTKPAASVRSSQPFNWTQPELTLSFWAAPLAGTTKSLVELRLSDDSLVLAVMTDSVTFGGGGLEPFGTLSGSPVRFEVGKWNHFSITITMTKFVLYHNGRRFKQATLNAALPTPHQLMASYVGEEFQGYISQVVVFQRFLNYSSVLDLYQEKPLSSDVVLTWSGYDLTTNVWSRLIQNPATPRVNRKVCEDGKSGTACDGAKPDKEPPSVPNCPGDQSATKRRLAQVNDFFNGEQFMSNINGTVIPVGAHRLVFMAKDDQNNVAFCRFNVYIKRSGQMQDSNQDCGVTDGLNTDLMTSCGTRGQTVQCPNNGAAPLSPKILTCGRLGAYNWAMPDLLPPAIVCGDAQALRYRIHLKLAYRLGVNCVSEETNHISQALKDKVKTLRVQWSNLCEDISCDTANTSDVTCTGNLVIANVIINAVPATLTNMAGLELTAKELIQKSAQEDSAFNIPDYYGAQLQMNEIEITAEPGCVEGYGLHHGMCVMCAKGSFLNKETKMCELCPVGKFSTVDKATECEQCPSGQTTIQLGATNCVDECLAGSAYNTSSEQCTPCPKDFYTDQNGQVYCRFCPANTDNEGPGSTTSTGCFDTCPAGTELNSSVCVPCPRGKYSDGIEIDRCQDCSAGRTTAGEASTSSNSCDQTACSPGYFRNTTTNQCEVCDYGQYQPDKWQDQCLRCNDSYTTNTTASTSSEQCLYYCGAGHELVNQTCIPCARGTYKSNDGLAKLDGCKPCGDGNTTDTTASDSEQDCMIKICSAGQIISANGDCEDCPQDSYQENDLPSRDTVCQPCGQGKETKGIKQTSQDQCIPVCGPGEQYDVTKDSCEPCPMGTYNTGNVTQRFEQCASCPDGYVTVNETTGAISMLNCSLRNCSAGEYINGEDCLPCPLGQYQEKPRQSSCDNCRANTNTSREGSNSSANCSISCELGHVQIPNTESDCQLCQPDTIKPSDGPGSCTPCTGNYTANADRTACNIPYCDRGFQLSEDGTACLACEVGEFKSERGNATQCERCPSNTTTSSVASTSRGDCTAANCVPGFFSADGFLPCQACPRGTYKNSTGNEACTNCLVNTTPNEASTSAAQCSVVVCPLGQYRAQNVCVNCTKGFFANETGLTECLGCGQNSTTVHSGAGSADLCVPFCGLGEYLNETAKVCLECPLGEYNPVAGSLGQVVLQCKPCPDGKTTSNMGSKNITDCDIVDCGPGWFRSNNGGCKECPLGFYQPMKSQLTCHKCADGLTTLLTKRTQNDSCVEECKGGREYNLVNKTCEPCPLGSYRNEMESVHCILCPEGFTTVVTGQTSCTPKTGPTPTLPKVTIRITALLRVLPCRSGGAVDYQEIANAVYDALKDIIKMVSIVDYPAICASNCNNVRVVFKTGCLEGRRRTKREAATDQLVEIVVSNVSQTVDQKDNNKTSSTKGVIERAFYDVQNTEQLQKIQESLQVEFVEVTSVDQEYTCLPGHAINGTECSQCAAGTYSSYGDKCEPCPVDMYQNNAGFSSCINCPDKTFVATTGSSQLSQCIRKCSEANAGQTYCSGHGQCVFDQTAPDGVSCDCEDIYSGSDCSMREASTDNQTYMIAGIVGGSCAFLLIVLVIFGVVVCLRRSMRKGGSTQNGSKDDRRLREDDATMSEAYNNYNFPIYNNPAYDNSGLVSRHGGPPIMYFDPALTGTDDDVRDFYASDRSRKQSRPRSRSYAEEWNTLPDV